MKRSISFTVVNTKFNKVIDINTMSGGELTRLRIVLLLAILKAIKTLTGISTNLLVFDEALDTLDGSAAEDLALLFNHFL